jgi:hypothetical protein
MGDRFIGRAELAAPGSAMTSGQLQYFFVPLSAPGPPFTRDIARSSYRIFKPGTRDRIRLVIPLVTGNISSILRKDRFDLADFYGSESRGYAGFSRTRHLYALRSCFMRLDFGT